MKFKGFTNPALNFDSVDVKLATADRLHLLSCATCGFATKEMFCCDCNHVYCDSCPNAMDDSNLEIDVPTVTCALCRCATSCMKIKLHEEFVAQLQFVCPQCKVIVQLKHLKRHLEWCVQLSKSLSPSSTNERTSESTTAISNCLKKEVKDIKKQPSNRSSTNRSCDSEVTAETLSSVRRELVEIIAAGQGDLGANRLTNSKQQLSSLVKEILSRDNQQRCYELMFMSRIVDINSESKLYSTPGVTFRGRTFMFQIRSDAKSSVDMIVVAVDKNVAVEDSKQVIRISLNSFDGTVWSDKVTKDITSIWTGMKVSFPARADSNRVLGVEFELKSKR